MIVLNESPTDLTTPLRPPRILSWFDSLAAGRCTLPQFSRWVLEACRKDPGASDGVLLLLEEYADAGKLKQFDFRPLQRELHRRGRLAESPREEAIDSNGEQAAPTPRVRRYSRDPDPTQAMPPSLDANGIDDELEASRSEPRIEPANGIAAASANAIFEEPPSAAAPAASEPVPTPASAAMTAPVGPTSVLRDRYVLQDEIGRGGVGTVYRALDRNRAGLPHDQQFVALKVVREEHARSPDTLHALLREFHQAQSLSHPGIVNVFDFDHEGETHFVTMELLDGESLGALIRRSLPHPIARETANRILRELGDAISYAHQRDVLHMDLKPGNVMVESDGHVRVLDFGLAQTFMAEPWISDVVVPPAATPAYASCERLVGDLPDVRDDIFSFACLAYEVLGGKHPFDRGSALEARNLGRKPRRIRGLSSRQWRTLKRGLAWSREDRPASMQELLDGLALPAAPLRRRVRYRSRSRATARVGTRRPVIALALLALAGIAVLVWNYAPPDLRTSVGEQAIAAGSMLGQTAGAVREQIVALTTPATDARDEEATSATASPGPVAPVVEQRLPTAELTTPSPALAPPSPDIALTAPGVAPDTTSPADPMALVFAPPDGATATPAAAAPPVAQAPEGPGRLEFASDTFNVSESDATARIAVRRRGGAAGAVSFTWRTIDDSAVSGEDYAAGEFQETMAAGQTTATLLIPIVADSVAEYTELLDVVIEDASGAALGSLVRVPVVIIDDD